jgi:uncharacterized protein YjbI with pentapeptide repeats
MNAPFETPDTLRERWKSGIWKEALDAILAEAKRAKHRISAKFLNSLALPRFDSRLDLRGAPFYEPIDPPIRGADKRSFGFADDTYDRIDLSHALISFYVYDAKLNDCCFNGAAMTSCRFGSSHLLGCNFTGAVMPWLAIETNTVVTRCNFDYSKIRHDACVYGYASFEECSFQEIDWRMVEILGCRMTRCVFSGKLEKSKIKEPWGTGFQVIRDWFFKRKYKGYNIFDRCSFEALTVSRLSVREGSLVLNDCLGFPVFSTPSEEGPFYRNYYSDNTKPKTAE